MVSRACACTGLTTYLHAPADGFDQRGDSRALFAVQSGQGGGGTEGAWGSVSDAAVMHRGGAHSSHGVANSMRSRL